MMFAIDLLNFFYGETPQTEDPPEAETIEQYETEQPQLTKEQIAIKKANAEAAKYRVALKKLQEEIEAERAAKQKQEQEAEMAKLDEIGRLQKEKERLEKEKARADELAKEASKIVENVVIENAITDEASKLGFRNPALAKTLISNILDSVKIIDGKVADPDIITDALTELLETEPYLKKEEPARIEKPKVVSRASENVPKNQSQRSIDDEVEEQNKIIRESKPTDGVTRARAFLKKYIMLQENSPKPKEIS